MKWIKRLIPVLLFLPLYVSADTYPEVVFDNSLISGSYARSYVQYSGKSWVENVNKHLLVSDTLFFTPGNALSLKYISAEEGDWRVNIRYSRQKILYRVLDSDFLTFRLFIKSNGTKPEVLPQISLSQRRMHIASVDIAKYIAEFKYDTWLVVKIPCKDFKGLDNDKPISGITLSQKGVSSGVHHFFLDQIEFLPKSYSQVKLSSPAVLISAEAYDKMVHLKWQLPLTPSIRYIKIYRSMDGKDYVPVGIKPIHMQSCLDDVPIIGQKYFYKLTWLDYNYNESPFSVAKEVQTKQMETARVLDLIQLAHVNYFIENYDVNSGMYMPYRLKEKAVVSTKETGGAILSLIVGVERGQISRQAVFNRLSRMVDFLSKAQNYHGIFPAYFDGRKAMPEHVLGGGKYDVSATSSIIEALLVARQYFSKDNDEEYNLRNRISALYERINWPLLTMQDSSEVLSKNIAADKANFEDRNEPISGPNYAMNTYILAIGSPKYNLPVSSYTHSVYHVYDSVRMDTLEKLAIDVYTDSLSIDSVVQDQVQVLRQMDTLVRVSAIDTLFRYGERVLLGDMKGSLLDLYRPFLTIRPQIVSDSIFHWEEILRSYAHFVKRRDNELGVGVNDSDIWGFYQYGRGEGNFRINPVIGPSSIIVDRQIGEGALIALYRNFGKNLFTEYGFRAWLDLRNDDVSDEYLAANQSTLAIMIENARTGLIWDLYTQIPELQWARSKLFGGN